MAGKQASGILGAVQGGSAGLAPIDPFQDISPIAIPFIPDQSNTNLDVLDDFVNVQDDDEDDEESEWEDGEDDFQRNAFDFIIGDEEVD